MGLTQTNALVAIAAGGAPVAQAPNATFTVAAGATLTFSLQSINLVQRWELSITCDDQTLNGRKLVWQAGQANQLQLPTPVAPYVMGYQSLVSDGTSSTAQVTGQVTSSGTSPTTAGSTTTSGPFTMPSVWTVAAPTTLSIGVQSSAGMSIGAGLTLPGFGSFIVSSVPDITHVGVINTGASGNASAGTTVPSATAVNIAGSGAPLAVAAPLNGQSAQVVNGTLTYLGNKPHNHFSSYNPSTTDGTVNAAAFEAMLADAAANGYDCYCPTGTFKHTRPIFWTQQGVRVHCPKVDGVSDTRAFHLQPLSTNATDWYGPQIIMGAETPEPLWIGPDAHGMYMLPLGNTAISNDEVAYIPLGSLDAMSLNGIGAIGIDIKYFYPAGGNGGSQWAIFFAGGGSIPGATPVQTISVSVVGSDQVNLIGTTATGGFFSVSATTGNKLVQNATNDIGISYDGTHWRIFVNGVLDTTISGHTGNLTVDVGFNRMFIGRSSDSTWLADGTGDGPNGVVTALAGSAVGDFMISFGGTSVTRTTSYTPANRYVRDDTTTWTPPGGGTSHCTGILINFDVANRASTVCGHTGWILAQCNVSRSPQIPRNPGNVVWLSCGSRQQIFRPFNAIHDMVLSGFIGLYASVCPFTILDHVISVQWAIGAALTNFSYFSEVFGGNYVAQLGVSDPGLYVGDFWGLALLCEGCKVYGAQANGGNASMVGSGGYFQTPYIDIGGYFGLALTGIPRVSTVVDPHIYNESNATTLHSLLACVGVGMATINGGLIGNAGSDVPRAVSVWGGGSVQLNGVTFTGVDAGVGFTTPAGASPPLSPVKISGFPGGTFPWLEAANPGLLVFDQNRGVSALASGSNANRTVTDNEFFAGYILKLTGSNWLSGHNLVLPYVVEGDERIVHNTEAQTLTIKPGSVTVATNAYARVIADGTNWVTSP